MRKTLTDAAVQRLPAKPKRYTLPDPDLRGHYLRVTPTGAKTFVAVARDPEGKQQWALIGPADVLSIDEARQQARTVLTRIRAGEPAFEPKAESFEAVARDWLKRHVAKKKLRSAKQIERLLELHVFPFWEKREFLSIKRSDVVALLDDIEDDHSPRQADAVLTLVRSLMNWYATRHDDYSTPVVRGMRRQSPAEQRRERILSDDEIREVWKAAESSDTFGAFVHVALLSAQRRAKVLNMKWSDLAEDGTWTIPMDDPREKTSAGSLVLPQVALDIINSLPRLGVPPSPFVFASSLTLAPLNGMSKLKRRFDARLTAVQPWVLHDLRRTARSLMSRAGISSEHAERVLGHAIAGVEGVYDRHRYADEKRDALARLAALVEAVVHPRPNVVPIKGSTR